MRTRVLLMLPSASTIGKRFAAGTMPSSAIVISSSQPLASNVASLTNFSVAAKMALPRSKISLPASVKLAR
ncbi:Uncharacterised protein [Vibrio cholerae]|nr:Uncharacterised protein [Vibrio cholerae]